MKILLTGCAGFIGFHITRELLKLGHDVTGIDNLDTYNDKKLKTERLAQLKNTKLSFINLDINNLTEIKNDFDLVINLAAQPGVRLPKSDWHKYYHSNVNGFIGLCNFCLTNEKTKLIYASSSSVYSASAKNNPSCETDKLGPSSVYGATKVFNEIYAETLSKSHGLKSIGFRFFTVYGPWGRPDMGYFLFSQQIRDSKEIILHNQGDMFRDMTYIEDIVSGVKSGIGMITKNKFNGHELFNLGCNDPIKTSHLLDFIGRFFDKNYTFKNVDVNYESKYTHADLNKARKMLGYNPTINFETGMSRFLEWFKKYEN